jgi:hypothetical protein
MNQDLCGSEQSEEDYDRVRRYSWGRGQVSARHQILEGVVRDEVQTFSVLESSEESA